MWFFKIMQHKKTVSFIRFDPGIREYLKQHFKTKLKLPRKSHYKKDLKAEKAFLKTP
jgi:hypothetical protein